MLIIILIALTLILKKLYKKLPFLLNRYNNLNNKFKNEIHEVITLCKNV